MSHRVTGAITFAAVSTLAAASLWAGAASDRIPATRAGTARAERLEQASTTERRLSALADARAAGLFGGPREPIVHRAAPGWAGEQVVSGVRDDWEPAIAADPRKPYAYILTTRFGYRTPCPDGDCLIPHISLTISEDGGRTWSDPRPLCRCAGPWQYDPIIEVVENTGHIYAMYMNGYNVVFVKSRDHGRTWSDPVKTYGAVAWTDKPAFATSANGKHIYLSFNGPTGGDPWLAQSHDRGRTWTQSLFVDSDRYYFAYDGAVLRDGTVVLSQSSFDYSGPGATAVGRVRQYVFVSHDRGSTWRRVLLDTLHLGPICRSQGCYDDFHMGHSGVSADRSGDLVVVYDGAHRPYGPQRSYARTSTDGGRTWSSRTLLSHAGQNSIAPTVEATGVGEVRVWFAAQNGSGRWNVYFRSSDDLGATWSARVKISDAVSGAAYKDGRGFLEFYGDYGEIAITSEGATIGVWGEAFSYNGPGGVWFNRQV